MIEKEIRALLPLWAGCCLALVVAPGAQRPLGWLGPVAYLLGTAAIGAWSVGHEYSLRTIDSALTLPVSRTRLWLTKLAVTAILLAAFSAVAYWSLGSRTSDVPMGSALFYMPAVAGVFIAPWLTVVSRTPLAGVVFPLGLAGGLMVVAEWLGVRVHGFTGDVDLFRARFMVATVGSLAAIAAPLGWRAFAGLESTGWRQFEVAVVSRRRFAAANVASRRRHPLAMLVRKELRLQQLAFAVAPGYVFIYATLVLTFAARSDFADFAVVITIIYAGILSMLVGALASAEERHLGTHDAQLLMPVSAARQWAVKACCAVIVALLLATLLPAIVNVAARPAHFAALGREGMIQPKTVALVMAFTSLSLYVSVLSSNGLRALLLTVPLLLAMISLAERFAFAVSYGTFNWLYVRHGGRVMPHPRISPDTLLWGGMLGLAALAVWRAYAHYRYADRNALRIAGDAGLLVSALFIYWGLSGALLY